MARKLHPITAENLHIFTHEQQKKIREMQPDINATRTMSQNSKYRVGLMAEFGVSTHPVKDFCR